MKFAIVLLVLLPLALGAPMEEKRILLDQLSQFTSGSGGLLAQAKQMLSMFGTPESELQCEQTTCPQFLQLSPVHISLVEDLLCKSLCKQVEVLAKHVQQN